MGVVKKAVKHNFKSTTTVTVIQLVQPLFDATITGKSLAILDYLCVFRLALALNSTVKVFCQVEL